MAYKSRAFTFNMCIHWEKGGKGRYIGLLRIWELQLIPWFKDDGDRGFFEWLIFRCGWYPEKAQRGEIGPFARKALSGLITGKSPGDLEREHIMGL